MEFFSKNVRKNIHLLRQLANQNNTLPDRVVNGVISLLSDPKADDGQHWYYSDAACAAATLEGVAKGGRPFPEKAIHELTVLLAAPKALIYTRISAAEALCEVMKRGIPIPELAVSNLLQLLRKPLEVSSCYFDFSDRIATALNAVMRKDSPHLEQVINELISILSDSKVLGEAKELATQILSTAMNEGISLPEQVTSMLTLHLEAAKAKRKDKTDPGEATYKYRSSDRDLSEHEISELIFRLTDMKYHRGKISAADGLCKFAIKGNPLPKRAVDGLVSLFMDLSQSTRSKYASWGFAASCPDIGSLQTSIIQVFCREAKNGYLLSEQVIDKFISLLKESKTGQGTKSRIYETFCQIDVKSYQAQKMNKSLLEKICKFSGRMFYQKLDDRYCIADSREIVVVGDKHEGDCILQ